LCARRTQSILNPDTSSLRLLLLPISLESTRPVNPLEQRIASTALLQIHSASAQNSGWYLVIIIAAVILTALMVVLLLLTDRRRRRAEEERERFALLARSGSRHLDEVVANVPGIVWEIVIDPETRRTKTTFVSDYVEQMLGYTPAEWRAQAPGFGLRLMPYNEDRERAQLDTNAVLATGRHGFTQFRWRAKDNRVLWIESHLSPILDENRKVVGLRGVSLDITERKQAEKTLRQTQEKNDAILRAIPDVMFLLTVDGDYLDYHAKNPKELVVPPEEFLGKNIRDIMPPALAKKFLDAFERAAVSSEPQVAEYKLTIDQQDRWLEARIVRTGDNILKVVRDITERVEAELALQESEARFRNVADTAPVMIWLSDPDKRCTYVNQQWLNFKGRELEQELGSGWAEGIHPEDQDRALQTFMNASDRHEGFQMEYRLKRYDGTYRWIYDSGAPRYSPDGEFLGCIGSCVDITTRKESEEELHKALNEVSRLKNQLQEENVYLQEEIKLGQDFGEIIGQSDALKYVLFKIAQVAPTETTVLITGETGTGKELVARAIHNASARRDRPMVKVNCAALSASLIESELFGHEKGAFTGAGARKIGRFELADGATIFLDEIGDLPLSLQVKLLRVIQEGEFERLGSSKTLKVDVRIIAATNRNLELEVKAGRFREDLWYRLNVFPITVPPLRQRREDIPLLVQHFINRFAKKLGKTITAVSPQTLQGLHDFSWPGNVRELANVIERAVINAPGPVLRMGEKLETTEPDLATSSRTLEEIERDYITHVLEDRAWRIEGEHGAAKILGVNPSTLRGRIAKLGIQRPSHSSLLEEG
jgi:PAS domain S-box-containing protein